MKPQCAFFEYERKLTACALGEPSITLVRNDSEFGLLLATGAHEDSYTGNLWLDDVTYLRVYGQNYAYAQFPSVVICEQDGVWLAQDADADRYFPSPSERPYHIIFISQGEFSNLNRVREGGRAFPLFQSAQEHFGHLPGFSYRQNELRAPDDYANRFDYINRDVYIYPEQRRTRRRS